MNIGEFFVNLGVKGSEKTIAAFSGVKKNLGEVSSMSLEAKAGILGAFYALEQLMSKSSQAGTGLSNFAALTGLSTRTLQQWQYAAQQAGESNEEFTSSLKNVYDNMAKMKLNKGQPEGMGLVATTLGLSQKDLDRAKDDVFFLMGQLQKFANSKVPIDVQNQALKSFGLSENTIAAMRKNVFNETNFKHAPLYGEGEINQLNKVDVAWKNLGQKIEMAFGHFNAKHGMEIIRDLTKITDQVFRLADAFTRLAEKLKVFEAIGTAVDGIAKILMLLNGDTLEKVEKGDKLKEHHFGDNTWWMNGINAMEDKLLDLKAKATEPTFRGVAPNPNKTQHFNIQQNLKFEHDGKDHQKVRDSHHKAIRDAYKQLSSQTQGA